MTVPWRGISVDPGCRKGHGVAFWEGGELLCAKLFPVTDEVRPPDNTKAQSALVIEIPKVRVTGLQKGRQKDIVDLAVAAGSFIGRHQAQFQQVIEVSPEEWGGQTPARIKYDRILERLTGAELSRIEWPTTKALKTDVIMAVGIGLFVFDPKRSLVRRGK